MGGSGIRTIEISGQHYPVEISWKSMDAWRKLIKLYNLKNYKDKKIAFAYGCFIAARHSVESDFKIMFSDFYKYCKSDESIVDDIGELLAKTDTVTCNLAQFWFRNHVLN